MKLLAPQNNWSMKDSSSWWGSIGAVPSAAGVYVSKESALRMSAVFCCTRIISETVAHLPLQVIEQQDARTTRKATDHPLWRVLHYMPTPEQDKMSWFDMQVALQLNWGNAYAEIERNSLGQIVALWPIHPSRIPLRNIRRNGRDPSTWPSIVAGQPGEIVYWVNDDDGTAYPVPASDMFHVPGVLSSNGVTGISIIEWGANSIGLAAAKEQHASAFFRNGAASNIALMSKAKVGKETAERLREQWQRMYGGSQNHYKALLLEDGIEPREISVNPEASQLLESQKFSVLDIARFYRMQPHKLGDLGRAIQSNIEAENSSFVTDTMMPWIVRWEMAIYRQLLSAEEKRRFYAKFNVAAMLRGDSGQRAALYTALFNLASLSPNDIRALEEMNPIDGGDQYFIPANNLFPLDKASEMAQAQIERLKAPQAAPQQPLADDNSDDGDDSGETADGAMARMIAAIRQHETRPAEQLAIRENAVAQSEKKLRAAIRQAIAARMTGLTEYEVRAIRQAVKKPETFLTWQGEFYAEFRGKMCDALSPFQDVAGGFSASDVATNYINDSMAALSPLADVACSGLEAAALALLADWGSRPHGLAEFIVPELEGASCAA